MPVAASPGLYLPEGMILLGPLDAEPTNMDNVDDSSYISGIQVQRGKSGTVFSNVEQVDAVTMKIQKPGSQKKMIGVSTMIGSLQKEIEELRDSSQEISSLISNAQKKSEELGDSLKELQQEQEEGRKRLKDIRALTYSIEVTLQELISIMPQGRIDSMDNCRISSPNA